MSLDAFDLFEWVIRHQEAVIIACLIGGRELVALVAQSNKACGRTEWQSCDNTRRGLTGL